MIARGGKETLHSHGPGIPFSGGFTVMRNEEVRLTPREVINVERLPKATLMYPSVWNGRRPTSNDKFLAS